MSKLRQSLVIFKERATPYRTLIIIVVAVGLLGVALLIKGEYSQASTLRVTFFDVGQGDSALVESPTRTRVLIDGGPHDDLSNHLARTLPFFDRDIDLILPSHVDADHITGLISYLASHQKISLGWVHATSETPFSRELIKDYSGGRSSYPLLAGDEIDIGGGATMKALLPYKGETFSKDQTNESSTVILLTYQGVSFLFTGDLPETRESLLLASPLLPSHVDVLKVGHHGSKYSTGSELLARLHAKICVVSVGKGNKYGHPSEEALTRIEKSGCEIRRTDEEGNIEIDIENGSVVAK